jgi:tRNA G10  N-methylase Trm11
MTAYPTIITFGNTPKLSILELQALLIRHAPHVRFTALNSQQLKLNLSPQTQKSLIRESGGIVKCALLLDSVVFEALGACILTHLLQNKPSDRFSLSSFSLSRAELHRLASDIKKKAPKPAASHFRILRSPMESAGIISKYPEYQIIAGKEMFEVAVTTEVQNINHWNAKDYQRPRSDPKSGMLPPKVARMMVNLALPAKYAQATVYDPFCGSGTILLEALDLGAHALGSDISKAAVEASIENCRWYTDRYAPQGSYSVFQLDATQIKKASVRADAVVFEGYLGPALPQPAKVDNILKGLSKLYKGVFKQLLSVIKPGQMVVAALPEIVSTSHVKNLDGLVDWCEKNGYTLKADPVTYARSKAVVRRRIYQLQAV